MPVAGSLQRRNRRDRAEAPDGPSRKRGCPGRDVSLRIFYATWRDVRALRSLDSCAVADGFGCARRLGSRGSQFLCGWSSEAFAAAETVLYMSPRHIFSGLKGLTGGNPP